MTTSPDQLNAPDHGPVQIAIDGFRAACIADSVNPTSETKGRLQHAEMALWEAIGAFAKEESRVDRTYRERLNDQAGAAGNREGPR